MRRNLGNFQEEWQHGADGCGVHATGASFQNQDAFQYADWKDKTEWIEFVKWYSGVVDGFITLAREIDPAGSAASIDSASRVRGCRGDTARQGE